MKNCILICVLILINKSVLSQADSIFYFSIKENSNEIFLTCDFKNKIRTIKCTESQYKIKSFQITLCSLGKVYTYNNIGIHLPNGIIFILNNKVLNNEKLYIRNIKILNTKSNNEFIIKREYILLFNCVT